MSFKRGSVSRPWWTRGQAQLGHESDTIGYGIHSLSRGPFLRAMASTQKGTDEQASGQSLRESGLALCQPNNKGGSCDQGLDLFTAGGVEPDPPSV